MRIVIKIGSNVLTRKDGKLDVTRVSALVDQVAWLRQQGHEVILVKRVANATTFGLEECESHATTNDEVVDLVEKILDNSEFR